MHDVIISEKCLDKESYDHYINEIKTTPIIPYKGITNKYVYFQR